MNDAFDRGAYTGLPATGYKLVPLYDKRGCPVIGKDDDQIKALAIDEAAANVVRRVFVNYAESRNAPPPSPITLKDVEGYLADLHGLLNQDVALAAPILRELTGPITVDQVKEKGRPGYTWIAKFTVNLVPVLARLTAGKDYPTRDVWEFRIPLAANRWD